MTNSTNYDQNSGWEEIWKTGDIPNRFKSFAEANEGVVEWTKTVPPKSHILDIGCGVGRHVTYLGSRGFLMAGVDNSPSGIEQTQAICAEHQIPFEGKVADMTDLPWENNTFDAALSIDTIHHHRRPNMARALAEINRVLKPGGLFIVNFPNIATLTYQALRRLADEGEIKEVEPHTFVDDRPNPVDLDAYLPHHFSDEADIRGLLEHFEILNVEEEQRIITLNGETGNVGKWIVCVRKPLTE